MSTIHENFVLAQRNVLSCALGGEDVWHDVQPGDFDDGRLQMAAALIHSMPRVVGPATERIAEYRHEAIKRGVSAPDPFEWLTGMTDAGIALAQFHDLRRQIAAERAILRAADHLAKNVGTWSVVDELTDTLADLPRPSLDEGDPWWGHHDILGWDDEPEEWVIPGLLAHRERLVLTGREGGGKTLLSYQILVCAANGIDPVGLVDDYPPQRVMILDVENVHETQVARMYRNLTARLPRRHPNVADHLALLKARAIDLADPQQRRYVIDAVNAYEPDLVYMGAGYKLVEHEDWRVIAGSIQRTADQIRADVGSAFILETHAGHGTQEDRNGYRPEGTSQWLRWPEFGHGLSPDQDVTVRGHHPSRHVLWRGNRVHGRNWPYGWWPGAGLPMEPVRNEDEWEVRATTAAH